MSTYDKDHGRAEVQTLPTFVYIVASGLLILLALVSYGIAPLDLAGFDFAAAILIALLQAGLIAAIFLKDDRPFNGLVFLWAILLAAGFGAISICDSVASGATDDAPAPSAATAQASSYEDPYRELRESYEAAYRRAADMAAMAAASAIAEETASRPQSMR